MGVAIHQISPVAHLPLVLGVVRKLNVAALIDTFCPPHPAHILSCGRGVEALLLAILDGHHALYKVGARLEERGMVPLLQPGLRIPRSRAFRETRGAADVRPDLCRCAHDDCRRGHGLSRLAVEQWLAESGGLVDESHDASRTRTSPDGRYRRELRGGANSVAPRGQLVSCLRPGANRSHDRRLVCIWRHVSAKKGLALRGT